MKGLIGVVCGLALAVASAALAGGTPQPNGTMLTQNIVIPNCGELMSMPSDLTLACGDGNYGLTEITWRNWGSALTTGTGSARANDCMPYCAAGHFHEFAVEATASALRTCLTGQPQYTRLVLRYPGKRPAGVGRTDIWKFPCDAPGPGPTLTATPSSGRKVTLTGAGWPRVRTTAESCTPDVLLVFQGNGHGLIGHPTVTKTDSFRTTWTAPRVGRVVVIAMQTCSHAPSNLLQPSIGHYEAAVTVNVRS